MKIVLNKRYGGFGISKKAAEFMAEAGCAHAKAALEYLSAVKNPGGAIYGYAEGYNEFDRSNPYLVKAVETLGDEANASFSKLVVVDIPDGEDYVIEEYDGMESVRSAPAWKY